MIHRITLDDLLPKACHLSNLEITEMGERARRNLEIENLDLLEDGLRRIGGEVRRTHNFLHSLIVPRQGDFIIFVDESEGTFVSRVLIARNLAHYFLHYPLRSPVLDSEIMLVPKNTSGLAADEADKFATAFLMPEAIVREAHKHQHGIVVDIATQLGLGITTVRMRLNELGIITN